MPNELNPETDSKRPLIYQIRIEGHLGPHWTDWFEGALIAPEDNGDTLLTGLVVDQAALHGLLKRVRDLGMPLVSVNRVVPIEKDMPHPESEMNSAIVSESAKELETEFEGTELEQGGSAI